MYRVLTPSRELLRCEKRRQEHRGESSSTPLLSLSVWGHCTPNLTGQIDLGDVNQRKPCRTWQVRNNGLF